MTDQTDEHSWLYELVHCPAGAAKLFAALLEKVDPVLLLVSGSCPKGEHASIFSNRMKVLREKDFIRRVPRDGYVICEGLRLKTSPGLVMINPYIIAPKADRREDVFCAWENLPSAEEQNK